MSSTDVSSSRLYWPFSAGTEFLPPVVSATLRGARGNLCALRAAQIARISGVAAWETLFLAATATPVALQTQVIVFHSCKMAPQRNGQVWHGKRKVAILDKLKLLKHGTSQRRAAEQLDIIGFGLFCTIQSAFRGWIGPHRFDHPAACIRHFGPVRGWMIEPDSTVVSLRLPFLGEGPENGVGGLVLPRHVQVERPFRRHRLLRALPVHADGRRRHRHQKTQLGRRAPLRSNDFHVWMPNLVHFENKNDSFWL